MPVLSSQVQARGPLTAALVAVFLGALDLTVISTVLPRIVIDLEINTANLDRYIWVVNAYLLAYIVTIPIFGRVSDVLGRRLAFQVALALFLIGSIYSGFAEDLPHLIAGRAIQGAGGGALLPVALALVGDLLPPGKRAAAIGLVGAVDTLGWVLGPLWGAGIVALAGDSAHGWRWAFWINVPIGLLAAFVIQRKITSPGASPRPSASIDAIGALLLAISLLLLNLGLSSGGETGVTSGSAIRALGGTSNPLADLLPWLLLGAASAGTLFVLWERRARSPLVPVSMLRRPGFVPSVGANFLVGAALVVAMVDVPVTVALLVDPERVSLASALLLAPFTLLMALGSFAGGQLTGRLGARATATLGTFLVVAGYLLLWHAMGRRELEPMAPGLAIAGLGFGVLIAPIGATAIDAVRASERGVAASLTIVARLLGMTISISALTSFGIRRLQAFSADVPPVVRGENETTADFFLRQTAYIQDVAVPLGIKVVQETFLIATGIAILALVPIAAIRAKPDLEPAPEPD